MSKSIAHHRTPRAGTMLFAALLAIALTMAACEDDAQTVREANESAAASTATAETPTPSAEIQAMELEDGDCVNSTLPEGVTVDTVVIVPCSGDWQYRVLNSFQVSDSEAYPDESFFLDQVAEDCVRQTSFYLYPSAEIWEQGYRTVNCLQQASAPIISEFLERFEYDPEELSEDERSCLREWVAADADLLALVTAPDDPAVEGEFAQGLFRCVPDLFISELFEGFEYDPKELSEDERSCLREWVAADADLLALVTAPDDPAVEGEFAQGLFRCVPDLFISELFEGFEYDLEELSEDERSCLREWVTDGDLLTLVTALDDPAVEDEFVQGLVGCVPDLADPTPTPEPVADASLLPAEVYARIAPSIAFIETPAGTGSGVLIDGGYIVTNRHVFWPYESVGAWQYDDMQYQRHAESERFGRS